MGFWDNVNKELKTAVEEGWTVVKESAKIGKLRLKVHTLHNKAQKHFAEIGGIVYEMAKIPGENPLLNSKVLSFIEEIKKIETETQALELEIQKTKNKEAASTGTVK